MFDKGNFDLAVTGAAFRAANLSTAFRVRKVGISDISSFDIAVRMTTLPASSGSGGGGGGVGGFFGSLLGKKKQEPTGSNESLVKYYLYEIWLH